MSYKDKLKPIATTTATSTGSSTGSYKDKLKPVSAPPAPAPEPVKNNPLGNIMAGKAAFPSQKDDSVGSSLVKYAGNLPGATFNLARTAVAPVNPFDTKNPLNIGANVAKGGQALGDIFKNRGAVQGAKDIASGTAETIVGGAKTGLDFLKRKATEAVQNPAEFAGKIAEGVVNDPTVVPSLLYAPTKVRPVSNVAPDVISTVAKPVNTAVKAAGNVASKVLPDKDSVIQKRAAQFDNLFNSGGKTKNLVDKSKDKGYNPSLTLASNDRYIPEIKKGGKVVPDKAIKNIEADAEEQAKIINSIVKSENKYIPLNEWKRQAYSQIEDLKYSGDDYERVITQIEKDFASYQKFANKDGFVSLGVIDDVKSAKYRSINFTNNDLYTTDRAIARASRQLVEDSIDDVSIKDLNYELGRLYDAKEALESLNGRVVVGGRAGKYFTRGIGTLIGSVGGGISGGMVGLITADKLVDIMQSNYFQNPLVKKAVGEIAEENPEIFKEAMRILKEKEVTRSEQKQLSAPTTINANPPKPQQSEMQVFTEYEEFLKAQGLAPKPLALPPASGKPTGRPIPLLPRTQSSIDIKEKSKSSIKQPERKLPQFLQLPAPKTTAKGRPIPLLPKNQSKVDADERSNPNIKPPKGR